MAVYQATGIPAVSLPNGASSLPLEVLPLLERFDKVYLWMDHDGPGQAGVDKFVQKLVSMWACAWYGEFYPHCVVEVRCGYAVSSTIM